MIYRQLGRTGLRVSQLGFGAMRLPMTGGHDEGLVDLEQAIPMLHAAFDAGVNYVDTAVAYCNEDGQRAVGEAIKGRRDKIIISTKNPYYGDDEKAWWTNLENSLERLGVEFIDIYSHHGLRWKQYVEAVEPHLAKLMLKAKDQGLIRHIGCSFHDTNDALRKVIDTGYVESITLQYNMLDRQLADGIAYANEKGVGVVVMGPVAGGRLGMPSEQLEGVVPGISRVPELALRFVLSNPNVSIALSGMSTMQQVKENVEIASDSAGLTEEDKATIVEHLDRIQELAKLYCTGCGYCIPCPSDVNIPWVFSSYNLGRMYGLWESASKRYKRLLHREGKGKLADACTECGECEPKCPQNLEICKLLKEAHEALTGEAPGPPASKAKSKAL